MIFIHCQLIQEKDADWGETAIKLYISCSDGDDDCSWWTRTKVGDAVFLTWYVNFLPLYFTSCV